MALNLDAKTYAEASMDLFVFADMFGDDPKLILCVGIASENIRGVFDGRNQDHKIVRCKNPEAAYRLKSQLLTRQREGETKDEGGSGDYVYAYIKPNPAHPNA